MSTYIGAVNYYEAARGRGVLGHMVTFDDKGTIEVFIGDHENSWETMREDIALAMQMGARANLVLNNELGEVWVTEMGTVDLDVANHCLELAMLEVINRGRNVN